MKRVFIIHGWGSKPEAGWRPWLKRELEKKGFFVSVPEMPNSEHPRLNEWLPFLKKEVGKADKETYFVGHSLGCITILRLLETLKEKIGGAVLVSGFTDDLGQKEISSFFERSIKWKKINSVCKKFVAINSDNDPWVPLKFADILKEKLDAELIIKHNMKHMGDNDGFNELPFLLDSILKLAE